MHYLARFACLLALIAAPASAQQKRSLAPSSAWAVDYADERCALVRDFGTGKSRVQLHIQSYGYWSSFRVMVTGPGITAFDSPRGFASIRFPGDPEAREAVAIYGTVGGEPAASFGTVFAPFIDPALSRHLSEDERADLMHDYGKPDPAFDATVHALTVKLERGAPMELGTGNMAEPLKALRTCVDDLIKSWGADPEKQRTLSRLAKPIRSTVQKVQRAYPFRMLDKGMSAFVPVRVSVDAAGNVVSCVIQASAIDAQFKQYVCDGLAAKFEPALDADGKATDSIYSTSVIYMVG